MNKYPGIVGKKLGFSQVYDADGSVRRVTVVDTSPVTVVAKRTVEKDGYVALVLGIGERKEKRTKKPQAPLFKKAGISPKQTLRELRCEAEFADKFEVGKPMNLSEIFKEGERVDAQGQSRGRGFTGVIRRWSFAGMVSSHGTHEYFRHGGSIGTNMTPGRTLPNVKMPGHYGAETVSILNMKVVKVDAEKNLLLIEGGIPGSKNSLVMVRRTVKAPKAKGGALRA